MAECKVFRAGGAYAGKQGLTYFHGVSAESVGSRGLCLHGLTVPPGGRANAHLQRAGERRPLPDLEALVG